MLLPVIDWKGLLKDRRPRIVLMGAATLLLVAAGGALGYYLWPDPAPKPPPPIASSTLSQRAEYAATEDFNRRPMDQRLAWVEGQIQKTLEADDADFIRAWESLNPVQRERLRDNLEIVGLERMRRNVREFYKLPPSARTAYLDETLDELEKIDRKVRKALGSTNDPPPHLRNVAGTQPLSQQQIDRERLAAEDARLRKHATRMMVNEPADQRAKTVSYLAEMGRRQVQRTIGKALGLKPR